MKHTILALLISFISLHSASAKTVLIFSDLACSFNQIADPDDCLAVRALMDDASVDIMGLITTSGNGTAQSAKLMATKLFPSLPTFNLSTQYASNIDFEKCADAVLASREKLTILVFGPATQFNRFIKEHTAVLDNIEEVVFVAGRSPGAIFTVSSRGRTIKDLNYEKNRSAFIEVLPLLLKQKIRLTFIGFEAGMNVALPKGFLDTAYLAPQRRRWARMTKWWFGAQLPAFDLVAALFVTKYRGLLKCKHVTRIVTGKKLILETGRPESLVKFCTGV